MGVIESTYRHNVVTEVTIDIMVDDKNPNINIDQTSIKFTPYPDDQEFKKVLDRDFTIVEP